MINNIIFPIIFLVTLSGIIGILIALFSKIFHVEQNNMVEQIYEMLPKYNCGACGKPGCKGLAEEILQDKDAVYKCKPIKKEEIKKIIDFMIEKK